MNARLLYIILSGTALVVLAMLAYVTVRSGRPSRLTALAALAFVLVLAGILFGEDNLISDGLLTIGIVLAIADIFRKSRGPAG